MTVNYRETTENVTKWRRSFRVQIDNPYAGTPSVVFHEEDCLIMSDGEIIKRNAGQVQVTFDPSTIIPLINPWTGEPITNVDDVQQTASHIEAYILLHSLYIQNATLRDIPLPIEETEDPSSPPEDPSSPPA